MNPSPLEYVESLRIGTVEFVSPEEIKVLLEIEAPDSVALNTGTPRPFPRVNSYVLIPNDDGYLVGQVEWLTVEHSSYPKRQGMQDFGVVDLPYPLRKMSLNPLGTLRGTVKEGVDQYKFRRGADALPSVGDGVLLPTERQLRSIIESGDNRRVKIGTSPLAGNADVCVDPDRIFGRHLAVLGNTGSGKSCSVAGLIRWSLEAASVNNGTPNARFIVLDPNGEYTRAFGKDASITKARIFKIEPKEGEQPLRVPLWFWNSFEWSSFMQASGRTQRPLLRRALREVKSGRSDTHEGTEADKKLAFRRSMSSNLISIKRDLSLGVIKTDESRFGFRLKAIKDDAEQKIAEFPAQATLLKNLTGRIQEAIDATYHTFVKDGNTVEYYRAFTEEQVNRILDALSALLEDLGGIVYLEGPSEDTPRHFSGADFADHLQTLSEQENVTQYLDFLVMRIRTMLSDARIKAIVTDSEQEQVNLTNWLIEYIGGNKAENGSLTIIDLSLVPSEIIHITTAVVARMVFEALQRYRKLNDGHKVLPTVLVMEEAHTFVKRHKDDQENQDAAAICSQVFEQIAREGRKFGLGLVLSSQRPSELSPTVLSQCNTFLLHRLTNDRDQDLVHRLVPDNLRGLLRDLPSLPSQNAILLGWASELPVLVRMNDLPKAQQPQSDDPDFWSVWTGAAIREVDWRKVADDWQEETVSAPTPDLGSEQPSTETSPEAQGA